MAPRSTEITMENRVNDNNVDLHQIAATFDKPEVRATEGQKNDINESPRIEIEIYGVKKIVCLDTGAQATVISEQFFQ